MYFCHVNLFKKVKTRPKVLMNGSETRTRITHRQNWFRLIHYKEHGHTLVCLICICKNFVHRIKKNTKILSLILSLSKQRFFHVNFNKNCHYIYEYVLYCIYVVEIHWHPTANGVEKCTLHVNSRSSMRELIICTCIVLTIPPLPMLIYKPCRIAACMENLSQIN